MKSLSTWNYEESVEKVKTMVLKWSTLTVDLVESLFRAREELGNQGARTDLGQNCPKLTWGGYCEDIGLPKRTANSWLERYLPEQHKLLTPEELETKKAQEERAAKDAAMTESQKSYKRVTTFLRTGEKPEGWKNSDDERLKEERERTERIEKNMDEIKQKHEERLKNAPPQIDFGEISKMTDALIKHEERRTSFKESIRISHEGKDDPFNDAIIDYLETLADDNRRVEACYNIIKICKGIANQLQRRPA